MQQDRGNHEHDARRHQRPRRLSREKKKG
jgi:hypothetical protein